MTKKRDDIYLMKEALRISGQYDNVLRINDGVIEWKDGVTPFDINDTIALLRRDNNVRTVKAEARKRIDAVAPDYQRENANALWLSLLEKRQDGDTLTTAEKAWASAARQMRLTIKDIRNKSNLIEAHLATLTDAEAGAYDIENSPLWG